MIHVAILFARMSRFMDTEFSQPVTLVCPCCFFLCIIIIMIACSELRVNSVTTTVIMCVICKNTGVRSWTKIADMVSVGYRVVHAAHLAVTFGLMTSIESCPLVSWRARRRLIILGSREKFIVIVVIAWVKGRRDSWTCACAIAKS